MRENRFYTKETLASGAIIELERTVVVHITRVLRMQSGDQVTLFNGDGYDYLAELVIDNKKASARVLSQGENTTRSPLYSHLGQGICRGDRMDYSLQKAVEMGVSEITPIICERVQFRMDAKRVEKKMRHWQGVIIAACEQSGRADVSVLNPVTTLSDWLENKSGELLVLDPEAEQTVAQVMREMDSEKQRSIRVLVGPEGGLSSDEIALAEQHGYGVSLGPRILRTETAGTAILTLLQHLAGDL